MSGSMVQRGECAIFDKWQRAKYAIEAGADLVIELPTYYVLQSADIFASGAIEIFDKLNIIDAISFGSECGNVNMLSSVAEIMETKEYNNEIKELLNSGLSYPKASEQALIKCLSTTDKKLFKPNNTLGICYIKALKRLNSNITPLSIKRDNDYHTDKTNDGFLSATQIRKMIDNNEEYFKYAYNYLNENTFNLKNAESYILGALRNTPINKFKTIKGYEDGLGELIYNSAKKACTTDELFEMCVSKRYTLHRIKRYVMALLLDISYDAKPEYIRILAMSEKGGRLIKKIREKSKLDIITKLADYKKDNLMLKTDIASTDLASLCANNIDLRYSGKDYTTSPYVKKGM